MPVIQYVPVPPALTQHIDMPRRPPEHCAYKGKPAVCVIDGLLQIPALRGLIKRANADRADASQLGGHDAGK